MLADHIQHYKDALSKANFEYYSNIIRASDRNSRSIFSTWLSAVKHVFYWSIQQFYDFSVSLRIKRFISNYFQVIPALYFYYFHFTNCCGNIVLYPEIYHLLARPIAY